MRTPLLGISVLALVAISTYYSLSFSNQESPAYQQIYIDPVLAQSQAFARSYADHFRQGVQDHGIPGAALVIVKDSTTLFMDGFGIRRKGSKDTVDINTVFRIGSLSKGFASVMTGILVERGLLSFDDRVNQYLPYFKLKSQAHTNKVTIKHLLSHTTGLPYHAYTNLIERGDQPKDIALSFKTLDLIGEPGEIYAYQNAVYSLIHNISSVAANQSYEQIMQDWLFTPNQMPHTSTSYEAIRKTANKAMPHRYDRKRKRWRRSAITRKYYNAIPAGGINSSIKDMGEWLKLLMGQKPEIIHDTTLQELFAPLVKTNQGNRYFGRWEFKKEAYYGMGWRVVECEQDTIIYHGGYVNEYRAEIAFSQKHKIGVCALYNAPSSFSGACVPDFWRQYNKAMERQPVGPITLVE